MTIREFISTVRNTLDLVSPDNYKSGEYIYHVGVNTANLLIKREADSRKIFKNTSFFKTLPCVELEEVSVNTCGINLGNCQTIMRTKERLPSVFSSTFGSVVQVNNLVRDKNYNEVNPQVYQSVRLQQYQAKSKGYFWIEDGYLYIPDSKVSFISISGLFLPNTTNCKILDEPFPALDYLVMQIIELTVKQIAFTLNIRKDENPNLNENS